MFVNSVKGKIHCCTSGPPFPKKPEETVRESLEKLDQAQELDQNLLLKDPYVLDFLGLNDHYLEKDLEDAILRELEQFLLELGAVFPTLRK